MELNKVNSLVELFFEKYKNKSLETHDPFLQWLKPGNDGIVTWSEAENQINIFSDYLNILYIPNIGELVIFSFAFVGACIGFIWYNSYPAQVFMGDTGSLSIGAIIAVLAIIVKKELLIPLLCGIFLIENLSVIIQVSVFKITKKIFHNGKRIFLMAPIHHHFELKGVKEKKIVENFWKINILLVIFGIVLKINL